MVELELAEAKKMAFVDRASFDEPAEPAGDSPLGLQVQSASACLFVAVLAVCVSPIMFGFSLAFTSPAKIAMDGFIMAELENDPTAKKARLYSTTLQSDKYRNWIVFGDPSNGEPLANSAMYAALFNVGAVVGAFMGAPISDMLGRKKTVAFTAVPFCIAWGLTWYLEGWKALFALRILIGVAVGIGSAVTPCYIGEISTSGLRGSLGCANQLSVTIGILLVNVIGTYVVEHVVDDDFANHWDKQYKEPKAPPSFCDWRTLALWGLGISTFLFLMVFMPESPKWLAGKGDLEGAKQALGLLRAGDVSHELKEMQGQDNSRSIDENPNDDPAQATKGLCDYRMSLVIGISLMVFQQFSGCNAIMMYADEICADAGYPGAVLMAVQVALTGIACLIMERFGRRSLLLFAAAATAASHFAMAGFHFYNNGKARDDMANPNYAMLFLSLFIVGFSIGLGPIPWLILAELFPTEVRGSASSIATAVNWACSFVVCLAFDTLKDGLGMHGASALFGVICCCCFVFVAFVVPETRGKSVEEVLEAMSGQARDVSFESRAKAP